jgi:hypothetical protein
MPFGFGCFASELIESQALADDALYRNVEPLCIRYASVIKSVGLLIEIAE